VLATAELEKGKKCPLALASDYLPRARNFHLAVEEKDGEVRLKKL